MNERKQVFNIKKYLKKCLTKLGGGGNICKSPVIRRLHTAENKEICKKMKKFLTNTLSSANIKKLCDERLAGSTMSNL